MRKIILYIATSLDGKIADKDGGVGWLEEIPNPEKSDYGYAEFYDCIDTTIMGNSTYRQVLEFPVEFPYKYKKNYVITRDTSLTKDNNVIYISENVIDFIRDLKQMPGKDIWCVGGAELNALLLENQLIDELRLFVMPVILGRTVSTLKTLQPSKIKIARIKCFGNLLFSKLIDPKKLKLSGY